MLATRTPLALLALLLGLQLVTPAAVWMILLVGLAAVVVFVPGMFFVFLLLPLVPFLIGILALAGVGFGRPWSYALGSALFFGWVLAAVFPLAG